MVFRSSEIDSDTIWANLGGKNRNHIFIPVSMTSCSLQKLLADLCVNVILVSTPAKHCITSIILILTVLNFEFSKGGQKVFKGGANAPRLPLKETLPLEAEELPRLPREITSPGRKARSSKGTVWHDMVNRPTSIKTDTKK